LFTLTRRSGESIKISPDYSKVSPDTPIGDLFGEDGCITVSVNKAEFDSVRLIIEAMDGLSVIRTELIKRVTASNND